MQEPESKQTKANILETILSCPNTKILELFSENSLTCQIHILGETALDENVPKKFVLKLHKKDFSITLEEKDNSKMISNLQKIFSSPEKYFENDIYHKILTKNLIHNQIDVELIYPGTQKLIDKYRLLNYEKFHETYKKNAHYAKKLNLNPLNRTLGKYITGIPPRKFSRIKKKLGGL